MIGGVTVANAPLEQLATLVQDLDQKYVRNLVRLSQRGAWLRYRDAKTYPGAAFRFAREAERVMNYAFRSSSWNKSKGNTPSYVYTGHFRDSVLKRTPKTARATGPEVSTKFSIFGGVLNFFATMHGFDRATREKQVVHRRAYTRKGRNGQSISVRAYDQRANRQTKRSRASSSYADQWGYSPTEVAWVAAQADAIGLQLFRSTALDSRGKLRLNPRVTKAKLNELLAEE